MAETRHQGYLCMCLPLYLEHGLMDSLFFFLFLQCYDFLLAYLWVDGEVWGGTRGSEAGPAGILSLCVNVCGTSFHEYSPLVVLSRSNGADTRRPLLVVIVLNRSSGFLATALCVRRGGHQRQLLQGRHLVVKKRCDFSQLAANRNVKKFTSYLFIFTFYVFDDGPYFKHIV